MVIILESFFYGGILMSGYKKKKLQIITVLISILLICLLTGCNKNTGGMGAGDSNESPINLTSAPALSEKQPEAYVSPDESEVTQDKLIEKNLSKEDDNVQLTEAPDLENFSEMDNYIINYAFEISYDENEDYDRKTYSIHGEYDLNGDGINENINALLIPYGEDGSYLSVNDKIVPLYLSDPAGEIYVIDIDKNDTYTEIAVYDFGPSADPVFDFFRYDGIELTYLFSIDRAALMDGQGKFISSFHLTTHFTPRFYSAWGEYKNGEYIISTHDISQFIGKTFELNDIAFFIPMEKEPQNYIEHIRWDSEFQRDFKSTQIKLLDMHVDEDDLILNWFFVELPDGEKGLLYFWIGD